MTNPQETACNSSLSLPPREAEGTSPSPLPRPSLRYGRATSPPSANAYQQRLSAARRRAARAGWGWSPEEIAAGHRHTPLPHSGNTPAFRVLHEQNQNRQARLMMDALARLRPSRAMPNSHAPSCNLRFPATLNTDDDYCSCAASPSPEVYPGQRAYEAAIAMTGPRHNNTPAPPMPLCPGGDFVIDPGPGFEPVWVRGASHLRVPPGGRIEQRGAVTWVVLHSRLGDGQAR